MSAFFINDQLSVICFHRENLSGPLFAVREFDTKVIRCRDKGRGKNRGPSEQAIRASIRQAILNLNLRSERANKHEIRLLKSQGIIGKRAPSCSLLNAEDMMTLLTYFDKEDAAEELRKAMQRETENQASELAEGKSKPQKLSRQPILTSSGYKYSRRLESGSEILASQYNKRRKIEQDEDIEEEIIEEEEDDQEVDEYDERSDIEEEEVEEIVQGEDEENKGEIKDSPVGKNGLEYLIAAAELSHAQELPILTPRFLSKNELKNELFIPDFSSILSPQSLFSPQSSRSSSPFSTLSSRSCSPAESLRAVSPPGLSEYNGDLLSPSSHRSNRPLDSPIFMESPFLRIQESPVPVESPLRSLSLTPTPLPVILGEQSLSIPDTPPKFPASFSSFSPSIYAIYSRYHKHTLRPNPVRSNSHPSSRLSFQGRLELASAMSNIQDENPNQLQVPHSPPSQ